MNIPQDPKGTAPEDVEAHGYRWTSAESQATEQDTGQDVEAHGRYASDESQATEQDTGQDVEGHRFRM